jgi:hypothetical protein
LENGFDSDDRLTAMLRSNLIEIAQTKRFSDAESLLDILLDRLKANLAVAARGAVDSAIPGQRA